MGYFNRYLLIFIMEKEYNITTIMSIFNDLRQKYAIIL